MKGVVFLVVGVILLVTAGIVFAALGGGNVGVSVNGVRLSAASAQQTMQVVRYAVSGFLGVLGVLFALGGMVAMGRSSATRKRQLQIIQTGVEAEGTVTFVDRNFRILVNRTPIYSIVEYTYQDRSGRSHTRRVDQVPSDLVIRKQIQVGSKIPVKFAAENPQESVMVLA